MKKVLRSEMSAEDIFVRSGQTVGRRDRNDG